MASASSKPKKGILKHRASFEASSVSSQGPANKHSSSGGFDSDAEYDSDTANSASAGAVSITPTTASSVALIDPDDIQRLRAPEWSSIGAQRRRTSFSDIAIVAATVPTGEDKASFGINYEDMLVQQLSPSGDPQHDADVDDSELTPEERRHRLEFLAKRKMHSHEYQAALMAAKAGDEDDGVGANSEDGVTAIVVVTGEADETKATASLAADDEQVNCVL